MRESATIGDADLRAMLRLAGEAGELPAGSDARRRHLLRGLRGIVGGACAAMFLLGRDPVGGALSDGGPVVWDAMSPGQEAAYERLIRRNPPPRNPIVPLLLRTPTPLITQHRRQVADENTWYHSAFYNEFRARWGWTTCSTPRRPCPAGCWRWRWCVRRASDRSGTANVAWSTCSTEKPAGSTASEPPPRAIRASPRCRRASGPS